MPESSELTIKVAQLMYALADDGGASKDVSDGGEGTSKVGDSTTSEDESPEIGPGSAASAPAAEEDSDIPDLKPKEVSVNAGAHML